MTRIFPDAKDYRTVNVAIDETKRSHIEKKLGFPLLQGQRDQFQYFEMMGNSGKKIGYIIAASQKGEYGAIEFVFGMDTSFTVESLYIQRSRERDSEFKRIEFIDSFRGVALTGGKPAVKPSSIKETAGVTAVLKGVKKELVSFDELVVKK